MKFLHATKIFQNFETINVQGRYTLFFNIYINEIYYILSFFSNRED